MKDIFKWGLPLGYNEDKSVEIQKIRFGVEEKSVIFLGRLVRQVKVHLVMADGCRRGFYAQCEGDGCRLCALKVKFREIILIPCYDPETRIVVVAQVSTSRHPGALAPQLERILTQADGPVWVAISTPDGVKHKARSCSIQPGDDDGEEPIKEFTKKVDSEEIDIYSVIPTLAEDDLETYGLVKR